MSKNVHFLERKENFLFNIIIIWKINNILKKPTN